VALTFATTSISQMHLAKVLFTFITLDSAAAIVRPTRATLDLQIADDDLGSQAERSSSGDPSPSPEIPETPERQVLSDSLRSAAYVNDTNVK